MTSSRLSYVDAMKGLAIVGIMAFHSTIPGMEQQYPFLTHIIGAGAKGVQIFLVISAYTLFLSLEKNKKAFSFSRYMSQRMIRILPVYYLVLFVSLLLLYVVMGQTRSVTDIMLTVFLLQGFDPHLVLASIIHVEWYLTVITVFYVICPFLYKKITTLTAALWLTFISLGVSVSLYFFLAQRPVVGDRVQWESYLYFSFLFHFPVLCLGIVLFFLERKISDNDRKHLPFFIFSFSCYLLVWVVTGKQFLIHEHFLSALAAMAILWSLARRPVELIVNKFWIFLGTISYSMYLIHYPLITYGRLWAKAWGYRAVSSNLLIEYLFQFLCLMIVTSLLSLLMFRFVELPTRYLARRSTDQNV